MAEVLRLTNAELAQMPPQASCDFELVQCASGLAMLSGHAHFDAPCEWTHREGGGVWLGVILQGLIAMDTGASACDYVAGLDSFAWLEAEPVPMRHVVPEAQDLQTIFLKVPNSLRGSCGALDAFCGAATTLRRHRGSIAHFHKSSASAGVHAVARQVLDCPHIGALRPLYLEAKALELLVAILDQFQGHDGRRECAACPRTGAERRLLDARNILIGELQAPPSLEELARRIGMSTSAMTAGFRRLFGQSIVEFLQERRLEHAFMALRDGQMTIAQAAYSAGYSRAHFSTLFRRRFGITPGDVVRQRS